MRKFTTILILLLCSIVAEAQIDSLSQKIGVITESTDTLTYSQRLSAEQMMLQLQGQISDMQRSLDQIQAKLDNQSNAKEIVPVQKKSKTHFYGSLQFGLLYTNDSYLDAGEGKGQTLGTRFSYALKPAFGYVFTPRFSAGLKIVFADCQFSGLTPSSIQYIIANALIGGGFSASDYLSWSVEPYARYRITKVFWKRVNLWADLSIYAGQKIPRDTQTRELQTWNSSIQYGIRLRPMLTIDLNRNFMFFSTMEFLSFNGSCRVNENGAFYNNAVNFQFVPIYSLLSGLFSLGIIKKF